MVLKKHNVLILDYSWLCQQDITKVRAIRMVPSAYVGNDGFKYYESLQLGFPSIKKKIHGLLGKGVMKLCNRQHNTMPNLQLRVDEDHLLEAILRTAGLPNLRWLRWIQIEEVRDLIHLGA